MSNNIFEYDAFDAFGKTILFYRGECIIDTPEEKKKVDEKIYNTLYNLYHNRSESIWKLIEDVVLPKIIFRYEVDILKSVNDKEEKAIDIISVVDWCEKFSIDHKFGKYGPKFMVKYISPIIDTRDNVVFAIEFRDLAWGDNMREYIPKEWIIKNGNTEKLLIRDIMNDGFTNLEERLIILSYIVKGSFENEVEFKD